MTLYIQLYLGGWGLELEDLKSLRTWGSKTPGHPEYGHTAGVETTTGPLRQGVANAVGMAMAARRDHGLLDPNAGEGESPFDHFVYAMASDGDLKEGVSGEASSIAGTQRLGNLILIYDDNAISIQDNTEIAFTEDVAARYEAYGWHVQTVDWTDGSDGGHANSSGYQEDVPALYDAISRPSASPTGRASSSSARSSAGRPPTSRTPSRPTATRSATPRWPPPRRSSASTRPRPSRSHRRSSSTPARRSSAARPRGPSGRRRTTPGRASRPPTSPLRTAADTHPAGRLGRRPADLPADDKGLATRKASGEVINAIAPRVPELWGGSADLAESNNTTIEGALSFLPKDRSARLWKGDPDQLLGAALRASASTPWARS